MFLFPNSDPYFIAGIHGEYDSMLDCLIKQEELIMQLGRPQINYQAVCMQEKSI